VESPEAVRKSFALVFIIVYASINTASRMFMATVARAIQQHRMTSTPSGSPDMSP
jgi:hypothetical protein